jgi:hypothetical protein
MVALAGHPALGDKVNSLALLNSASNFDHSDEVGPAAETHTCRTRPI